MTKEKIQIISNQFQEESKLYKYRTKDYPFEIIYNKYSDEDDENATLFVPSHQKKLIWKPNKQSKFIESVLLGVPLSPFIVAEKNGRLEIIDGFQRVRTLIDFFDNRFELKNLKVLTNINDAKYTALPNRLQSYLWNKDFRIIVVDNASKNIKQDIYKRINTK